MWKPGGTANRIFGDDASRAATWGHQHSREEELERERRKLQREVQEDQKAR